MKRKKSMGRPPKGEDKKLKNKIQVSLTDTDISDLEEFKKADQIDGDSDAMRRFFRWAMAKWKTEKGVPPPSASK